MRMLDIERYSSIFFLIFHRLAASDPWDAVLKVINNQMGFPINDVDLAACHFLHWSRTETNRPNLFIIIIAIWLGTIEIIRKQKRRLESLFMWVKG